MAGPVVLRGIATAAFGLAFLYISAINWIALVSRATRQRAPSWIPVLGGLLGLVAAFLEPSGRAAKWCWVAFIVDGGSLPGFMSVLVSKVFRR